VKLLKSCSGASKPSRSSSKTRLCVSVTLQAKPARLTADLIHGWKPASSEMPSVDNEVFFPGLWPLPTWYPEQAGKHLNHQSKQTILGMSYQWVTKSMAVWH